MTDEASPRPWRVEASPSQGKFWICRTTLGVSIGETWKESDAALICDAVNLYDRIEKARTDADGNKHLCILYGQPAVIVDPPPTEAEAVRSLRELNTSALRDRIMFQRACREIGIKCDEFADLVARLVQALEDANETNPYAKAARKLIAEARAAIGEYAK